MCLELVFKFVSTTRVNGRRYNIIAFQSSFVHGTPSSLEVLL